MPIANGHNYQIAMHDLNMLSMGLPTMFLLYRGLATLSPLHFHVLLSRLNTFCEKTCFILDWWARGLGVSLERNCLPVWVFWTLTWELKYKEFQHGYTSFQCRQPWVQVHPPHNLTSICCRLFGWPSHPSWLGWLDPPSPLPDYWRCSVPSGIVFNHLSFFLCPEPQPML